MDDRQILKPGSAPDRAAPTPRSGPFWLAEWFVQPSLNLVTGPASETRLEPRVMEVLVCLAQAGGRVVTRDEFMDRVWGDVVVTDDVLARCISDLRKSLGDEAAAPRFIETIRKSGYRLLQPARYDLDAAAGVLPDLPTDPTRQTRMKARRWGFVFAGSAIALLVGFAMKILLEPSPTQPQVLPFTSFPGEEIDPSLSPDGEAIAFAWNGGTGDAFELYLKQVGGEAPLQLTRAPGNERDPAWSPDGRQIAFIRETDAGCSIFVVPALGGGERELTAFEGRDIQGLLWSQSGDYLVFSAQQAPYSAFGIYLLEIATVTVRELTTPPDSYYGDTSPAFSPDESRLAFVRSIAPPIQDIYTVSLRGDAAPERLTTDHTEVTGIAWDPDGRHLLFASRRGGMSSLWSIATSGGTPTWVATAGDNANLREPSIDRSGDRLTVEQHTSYTNIWQLHRAQPPRPLIVSTRWDSDPAIAPDGSKLAYVSNQSGSHEIWISDADGGNAYQLTQLGGAFLGSPRWSPDGAALLFVSWERGNADIYEIDVAGGRPEPVLASPADELAPSWSRDGRWIYYATNARDRWQIWRAPIRHPAPADSTALPDSLGHAAADTAAVVTDGLAAIESDDGTALYFMKPNDTGIWRYLPEQDSAVVVVDGVLPVDSGNWNVVGNGIYYIDRTGRRPTISYFSFTTKRTTQIAMLSHLPRSNAFAVSPDGRWFLYAQTERSESDILLIENI
ncbi:MAG: winged helix-turn-helix domain-containing protein [Rhodothermales bacterium]